MANILKKGSNQTKLVKLLQEILNEKCKAKLTTDGDFGPATEKAVKDTQAKHKLTSDKPGTVGPQTAAKLLELTTKAKPLVAYCGAAGDSDENEELKALAKTIAYLKTGLQKFEGCKNSAIAVTLDFQKATSQIAANPKITSRQLPPHAQKDGKEIDKITKDAYWETKDYVKALEKASASSGLLPSFEFTQIRNNAPKGSETAKQAALITDLDKKIEDAEKECAKALDALGKAMADFQKMAKHVNWHPLGY